MGLQENSSDLSSGPGAVPRPNPMSFECNPIWFSSYRGEKKLTLPKSDAVLAARPLRATTFRDTCSLNDTCILHAE
eukprot:2888827-Prymnesium_polylepis.1